MSAWLLVAASVAWTDSVPKVASSSVAEPPPRRMSAVLDSAVPGTPLAPDSIRAALAKSVDQVVSDGFLAASATALAATATDSGVHLDIVAAPGQRFRWGGVRDAGTTRLSAPVLSRLSGIPVGEPADPSMMESARRRILSTGYVEEEAPARPVRRPRTALVDMLTTLRDRPSSSIEAAGGWTQGGNTSGVVEISLRDILGTARDLDFGLSNGEAGTHAHWMWKEPWIGPLNLEARVTGELLQDTLARSLEGSLELGWLSGDGALSLSGGLLLARRSERAVDDSVFGTESDEWGTRFALAWSSLPPPPWPVRLSSLRLQLDAVTASSDTGSLRRIRGQFHLDLYRPLGPFVARMGGDARGIWPLDESAGLSEARSPGGVAGWRGWPEGSPRTPAWAWATAELRLGSPRSGGVLAFVEPGTRALRRQDLTWSPAASWSAGGGAELVFPGWLVELVISARDDTRDWTESLLQVRAVNRF